MFFKESRSKRSKRPVLQLVENVRTAKGPRQRLIVSLGTNCAIPKESRKAVARIVRDKLRGQLSVFCDDPELIRYADDVVKKIQIDGKWHSTRERVQAFKDAQKNTKENTATETAEVFINQVEHSYTRELGPLLIGHTFWKRLGFPDVLRECGFKLGEIQTAELSILNRLIAQNNEYAMPAWLNTVAADELLGIDSKHFGKDRFYRISDKLHKHHVQIEEMLYQQEKDLFRLEDSIFLYDLTNTYFEGTAAQNPKAQYNKNQKEKRTDCPQVVVALVLDGDGFVRRHHVFEGKKSDVKSLKPILKEIKKGFNTAKLPTIIFDRGMASDENLKLLAQYDDLKYIIMCRPTEETQFIENYCSDEFDIVDGRQSDEEVKVLKKVQGDLTYLLCKSEGRKAKETAMRNQKEEALENELRNLEKQIKAGKSNHPEKIDQRIGRIKERFSKVAHYYQIDYAHWTFSYSVSETEKISKRLSKRLSALKNKADNNAITFPKLEKQIAEMKKRYSAEFENIKIYLKPATFIYNPDDGKQGDVTALDGNYLLKTNRTNLDATQIWKLYIMLTRVESAFRDLKSYLALRPNPHHKLHRVDGHILISILAYHLLHSIEYVLRSKGVNHRWITIKRVVSTYSYATIIMPTTEGTVINSRRPGQLEGVHMEIYDKLGVSYDGLPVRRSLA